MGLFGKSKKEKEAEYMERINVTRCLQQDFIMKVGGVFAIAGNGTVVAGRIESGMCRVGETAFILQNGTALEVVITGIDLRTKERKPNRAAYATEQVGIALRGVSKEQVQPGAVLAIKNGGKYEMQS